MLRRLIEYMQYLQAKFQLHIRIQNLEIYTIIQNVKLVHPEYAYSNQKNIV